jgi:hypothetical protein
MLVVIELPVLIIIHKFHIALFYNCAYEDLVSNLKFYKHHIVLLFHFYAKTRHIKLLSCLIFLVSIIMQKSLVNIGVTVQCGNCVEQLFSSKDIN